MLKDVGPPHMLILNCHWVCLKGINPYGTQALNLLQEARLLLECLSDDDTDADRVILGIINFESVLFIFNLKKTLAIMIKILNFDFVLFAK